MTINHNIYEKPQTRAIKMLTVKIETVITNQIQPQQLRRRIFKSTDVIRSKRSRDTGSRL
jgi:hypothetical protein